MLVAVHIFEHCFTVITVIMNIETVDLFFCLPDVKKLSFLHSGHVSWLKDKTRFSKLRDRLCLAINFYISVSNSHLVYNPVGIS